MYLSFVNFIIILFLISILPFFSFFFQKLEFITFLIFATHSRKYSCCQFLIYIYFTLYGCCICSLFLFYNYRSSMNIDLLVVVTDQGSRIKTSSSFDP